MQTMGEGKTARDYKGHKESLGGDGYVHYLNWGDGAQWIYIFVYTFQIVQFKQCILLHVNCTTIWLLKKMIAEDSYSLRKTIISKRLKIKNFKQAQFTPVFNPEKSSLYHTVWELKSFQRIFLRVEGVVLIIYGMKNESEESIRCL